MKNRSKNSNMINKDYLDKQFSIQREYLDKRFDRVLKYIDFRVDEVKKFKNEFSPFKELVTKSLDWLVGAFKRLDEERVVSSKQSERTNKQLENHEVRIKTLEKRTIYS